VTQESAPDALKRQYPNIYIYIHAYTHIHNIYNFLNKYITWGDLGIVGDAIKKYSFEKICYFFIIKKSQILNFFFKKAAEQLKPEGKRHCVKPKKKLASEIKKEKESKS
jgi:hypothetical protein